MRNLLEPDIARFRDPIGENIMKRLADDFVPGNPRHGVFQVPHHPTGVVLKVMVSAGGRGGEAWDHVSVSLPNRCPNRLEMSAVARLFFGEDEVAVQLHVQASDHVNVHPYTLHLVAPAR